MHKPTGWLARTTALLLLAGAGLLVPASLPPASAAEVECSSWAAPSGSDSASGSSTAPFRTASRLASALSGGQVGCLRTGTYSGDVAVTADGATLRSAPGERATLTLAQLRVPVGADDVTISDLTIIGDGTQLTTRLSGNRFTFTRNDVTNGNRGRDQIGSCVLVADSGTPSRGGVIRGNRLHECGALGSNFGHGIYAQNVEGLLIEDNIIRGVGSYAVQLYPRAYDVTVRHNVIDGGLGAGRGGIVIDGEGARHRIERNVIAYTATAALTVRVGSGHASVDNCFWGNASNVSGSISSSGDLTADPQFTDRAAADYRLGSGSACAARVGGSVSPGPSDPCAVPPAVTGAIRERYVALGSACGFLGAAVTGELTAAGGARYTDFRGGSIYWSSSTGAWEVHGDVRRRWLQLGGPAGALGLPTSNEGPAAGGAYGRFQRGWLYWSPATGAKLVRGAIHETWKSSGAERGPLGFPRADEAPTPRRAGAYSQFSGGSVHWSPQTGAHATWGAIREAWARSGWEDGPLGFPTSGEQGLAGRAGAVGRFERGSVYWSPATGAHEVRGAIRDAWLALGAEASPLGLPVTDEYDAGGVRRSDFERGSISWTPAGVVVRRTT